jgi:hypothetical protein
LLNQMRNSFQFFFISMMSQIVLDSRPVLPVTEIRTGCGLRELAGPEWLALQPFDVTGTHTACAGYTCSGTCLVWVRQGAMPKVLCLEAPLLHNCRMCNTATAISSGFYKDCNHCLCLKLDEDSPVVPCFGQPC